MSEVIRFGVSINSQLLERFDEVITRKGYVNRSEAIRDLIRNSLVELEWENEDKETVGTITLVYSHEISDLQERLTEFQHKQHPSIISSLHIHLDHHNCLEVLVVRGQGKSIKSIADRLISTKGVKHGRLTMATFGKDIS